MSLRPVKSRRSRKKLRAQLRAEQQWKPWKGWNWNGAVKKSFFGEFDPKAGFKIVLLFGLIISGIVVADYGFNGPITHNITVSTAGDQFNALQQSCNKWHVPSTCLSVEKGNFDPTFQVVKYTSPGNNLDEFNTAGTVTWQSSCSGGLGTGPCLLLTATTSPPIPHNGFFKGTGNLKITSATIIPQTPTFQYFWARGFSDNSTFAFNVQGSNDQTGVWKITTTGATTVSFFGPRPLTITCLSCSTQTYNGYAEVLTFGPGVSAQIFTIHFPASGFSQNINALFAMAESRVPIGDLTPASAKELELSFYWTASSNNTITKGACGTPVDYTCSWGMFLTTNATVFQTDDPNWTPYKDPSTVLYMANFVTGTNLFQTNTFIQQKAGEAIADEDPRSGCNQGSLYLCSLDNTAGGLGANGAASYLALNYTGASAGANVGSAVCPSTTPTVGGPGCSFLLLGVFNYPTHIAGTFVLPTLPLQGQSYYAGFFLGSKQLGSSFKFCYDAGSFCNSPQTWIVSGCASASLEIDYCIPSPCAAGGAPNCVNSVTDSGGFIGSAWRTLTSIGSSIASVTQPLWGPLAGIGNSLLSSFLGALEAAGSYVIQGLSLLEPAFVIVFNAIGNLVGFGNVGTDLQVIISGAITFFTTQVPTIFSNIGTVLLRFFDINSVYFQWLPTGLSIALNMLTLALNGIGFVLTIISFAFKAVTGVYVILFLVLFLAFTGDDALAGIWEFFAAFEFFVIWPMSWLIKILNFALDLVTHLIGIIPKPFVQMVAHAFPRLPVIETNVRFVWPRFDMAEIRNGNMLAVWCWFVDFTFLLWYNGVSPALPGSIGAIGGVPASTLTALRGMLIIPEIGLIVISALAFVVWPINKMLSMLSLDLDMLDFGVSPGSQPRSGPAGLRISAGKKHGFAARPLKTRQPEKGMLQQPDQRQLPITIIQDLRQRPEQRQPINVTPQREQLEDKSQ